MDVHTPYARNTFTHACINVRNITRGILRFLGALARTHIYLGGLLAHGKKALKLRIGIIFEVGAIAARLQQTGRIHRL